MMRSNASRIGLLAVAMISAVLAGCASSGAAPRAADPTRAETAAAYNLQLGVAYLQQGNLALAKDKLERALAQNARDPNVHGALAMLNEKLGKLADADKHYRTALKLSPRNPDLTNNYAVFLCRTGRVEDGVKRFMDAARNPLYQAPWRAYTNAGVCLRGANRLDEAAVSFGRSLRIRPNDAEALFQLADLELGRGRAPASRELLDRYLLTFPATADLLWLGARAARAQGDRLAEERFLRRLQRDFPDSEQSRESRGAARSGVSAP
jgi:type IV pilus assembly protein PilF